MKRIEQSLLLAGLLAMALAGCSSTGTGSMASTSDMGVSQGGGAGALNSTSDSGTAASASDTGTSYGSASTASTASGQSGTSAAATAPAIPNSTVTSIEVVQRQPGAATSGSTAVGGTGAGATGSSTGDRVYRITLRMDDGSTQVVTQEWAPVFSTGDRVRTISGAIQR